MIATLTGNIQFLYADRAVLNVQGVGYEVFLSADGLARLGEVGTEAFVFVHTHVREDAILLYGFVEEEEKELFLLLTAVSGVGPKLALAILSGMRVAEFSMAVSAKDIKRLTAISGVGKKTAERLCVELKEKVAGFSSAGDGQGETILANSAVSGTVMADVLSALINLGYPDPVARQALAAVKRRVGDESFARMKLEEMLKEGLQAIA